MQVEVFGELFELFPQKAVFWKTENILMIADLHLGKINHFRKSGIAVPSKANDKNIEVFVDLLLQIKPARVICLGDLFHSHYNPEWEIFGEVLKHFPQISFELVMGNHDIMSETQYIRKGIKVFDELYIQRFVLTHHSLEVVPDNFYNLSGHIHPGALLKGRGRQSVKLPCFYFGLQQGVLPAFGAFTGLACVEPKREEKVFVIADNKIIAI